MTVQYANEARSLTARSKWNLENILSAIDGAARTGESFVFLSGLLPKELNTELESRGFDIEINEGDTTVRW